ncbi:hypothetical protein DVS28_b0057 (plasmid) [Euzebya pacifica]|uniref:Uncharacterized protein n=1 Tax=Euzebya pacifica TaxID=1608957 RepID=A0A346Y5T0_9ACTN|nr:hypothetical protein DVS28_b0057 [Euzebya pacifica]
MMARRRKALPPSLVGAVRSRIGDPSDEMLAAVALADLVEMDKSRSPAGHVMKRRSCVEKVAYGARSARRAARQLRQGQGEEVHAYPCMFCAGWHVGHGIDIPVDARGVDAPVTPDPVGPPCPPAIEAWPGERPWGRRTVSVSAA